MQLDQETKEIRWISGMALLLSGVLAAAVCL